MNKRCSLYGLSVLCNFVILPGPLFSQQSKHSNVNPFTIEASYIGDNVNNLSGGIKTGSCYLGLVNLRIGFDTKKAGLWRGGQLYFNAANTHGASPSMEYIGDLQVASNIEAGIHTFFQELWVKQVFGKFELIAGLQDLNIQFVNTEYGSLFLNSSFGVLPTISDNIPAPVYPLTSMGLTCKWTTSEKITLVSALFDGCPTDFKENPNNLNWQFKEGDGLFIISEIQFSTTVGNRSGTYKVGLYSHNHWFTKPWNSAEYDSNCINNFGLYAIADQKLWHIDQKSIGAFLQLGYGPSRYNQNYFYIGGGINFQGVFKKNGNDAFGVACAIARLKGTIRCESTIELTYKTKLNNHFYLQPDVQYIIHPAGLCVPLDNGLEGTMRFGIGF